MDFDRLPNYPIASSVTRSRPSRSANSNYCGTAYDFPAASEGADVTFSYSTRCFIPSTGTTISTRPYLDSPDKLCLLLFLPRIQAMCSDASWYPRLYSHAPVIHQDRLRSKTRLKPHDPACSHVKVQILPFLCWHVVIHLVGLGSRPGAIVRAFPDRSFKENSLAIIHLSRTEARTLYCMSASDCSVPRSQHLASTGHRSRTRRHDRRRGGLRR